MNWSLGLFRLWLVLSAIYIVAVAMFFGPRVTHEFKAAQPIKGFELEVPIDCRLVQGIEGKDFHREQEGPWAHYRADPKLRYCYVSDDAARKAMPQYAGLSYQDLVDQLNHEAQLAGDIPYPRPWTTLWAVIAALLVPPLLILAVGSAFAWALRGFATT